MSPRCDKSGNRRVGRVDRLAREADQLERGAIEAAEAGRADQRHGRGAEPVAMAADLDADEEAGEIARAPVGAFAREQGRGAGAEDERGRKGRA